MPPSVGAYKESDHQTINFSYNMTEEPRRIAPLLPILFDLVRYRSVGIAGFQMHPDKIDECP